MARLLGQYAQNAPSNKELDRRKTTRAAVEKANGGKAVTGGGLLGNVVSKVEQASEVAHRALGDPGYQRPLDGAEKKAAAALKQKAIDNNRAKLWSK